MLSRFEDYYHGDEDSFDGPGGRAMNSMQFQIIPFCCGLMVSWVFAGVVAHAFFPEFGGELMPDC